MRADLLALTPDVLAALTNRGLLKRAQKEVDAGGYTVRVDADGTVSGTHPDGAEASLPPGVGLDAARCTCGAAGVCRHLIALVLAYQGQAAALEESAVAHWSPAEFTDDALEALFGTRALAAARRTYRGGYTARVRRPSTVDTAPSVELATCTVRFLVPHELSYAHTDAAGGARGDAVALAVWAYRVADALDATAELVDVDVGAERVSMAGSGLEAALDLSGDVLLDGVVHSGSSLGTAFARVRRDLDAAGLRWPLLAVDELADQLAAYHARNARYEPANVAALVAELHARHRAVTARGASLRSRVLGTEEAAETPLRRVRLVGLGCRIHASADDRRADVFLGHADTATVLVLRRSWPVDPEQAPTGADLANRRVGGAPLASLAAGNIVTESAARSASRLVRLASNRVAKTTIAPSTGDWDQLPDSLVVRDLAALARAMDTLPPRLVRPRIEAEFVRVVAVRSVVSIGYRPGAQRLDAVIADPSGATALVSAVHRSACPYALDALAEALEERHGPLRFVSGALHRSRGGIVVDPIAVVAGTRVVVPDLAPSRDAASFALAEADDPLPIPAAIDEALNLLAEAAHRGLRHTTPVFVDRLKAAQRTLTKIGLARAGADLDRLVGAMGPDPGTAAVQAWTDAAIRLLVTAECV